MTIEAYPLYWPEGWPRTRQPCASRYGKHSTYESTEKLEREIKLFNASSLIVSTNIRVKDNGLPYAGQKQPTDRGVAVYFTFKNKQRTFACDKWLTVEENLWAIVLTIEALRMINRAGASELLERAFTGFEALPAPSDMDVWWRVLEVSQTASKEEIQAAYYRKVKEVHPDKGGDSSQFIKIQRAYEESSRGQSI